MDVMKLEAYLDGALSPAEVAVVEAAMADPVVAGQLAQVRRQRAVRAAALGTYSPSSEESIALATRILDTCSAPVGSLVWLRRSAAVAAVLALTALSFYAGRSTSTSVAASGGPTVYIVKNVDPNGNVIHEQRFESYADADAYAKNLADQQQDQQSDAVALASPGIF